MGENSGAGSCRQEDWMEVDFYQLYRAEMDAIPVCTEDEERELLSALAKGDPAAGKRLAEGSLHLAVRLAEGYDNRGVSMGDLVEEANLALLLLIEELKGKCFEGDFKALARTRIREALVAAVTAQETEEKLEEEMAARVNVLKDISARLAEDLGREASVKELAEYMKMTEDEIKDIMKLTLDAVNVSRDRNN